MATSSLLQMKSCHRGWYHLVLLFRAPTILSQDGSPERCGKLVSLLCCVCLQDRLAGLFPGLATPMGNDSPTTYMQWGLACVRSRAFQLGKDRFAFVPFLDMANHSPTPNAAFRASETAAAIELVAVDDIDPGQEAVISYTERAGWELLFCPC